MNVYFARSIRGNHTADDMPAFNTIARVISAQHMLMWELAQKPGPTANTDEYIYQRDIDWIDQCKAMIAEVTNPSLGVGYEIAYARHAVKIPVLCIARKDTTVSAMIAGGNGVQYYRDLADLENLVETFLDGVSETLSIRKSR